jgi:hypothetical protein
VSRAAEGRKESESGKASTCSGPWRVLLKSKFCRLVLSLQLQTSLPALIRTVGRTNETD